MKNQFYQGIVKFTINYSLKILSFFNFRSIKIGVKIKPIQVKPKKQGQAQGNPPDLKFSLIIGHDYTYQNILPTILSFIPLEFFPPTSEQTFAVPFGNTFSTFPLNYS